MRKRKIKNNIKAEKLDWSLFVTFAVIAAFIRIIISYNAPGYSTDMGCFSSWTNTAISNGLHNFYQTTGFSDYPPGYIYVLYIFGIIPYIFKLSGQALEFFIKLPAMITDIITAVFVYKIAFRKTGSNKLSLICASVMLFNPLMIINSAGWGQIDSVFTFVLVLALYFMSEKKLIWGAFVYGIAILVKPQALIFGPAVLAIYIYQWNIKKFFISIVVGVFTIVGFALPFSINQQNPFWLFDLYYKTMFEQYKYTSLNAPNLYGAIGQNAIPLENNFLGLTYETWGSYFMVFAIISVLALFIIFSFREKNQRNFIYMLSAYTIFIVFMLVTKMHERYIFPVMLFLILDYIETRDLKSLYLSIGMSVVNAVCVGVLLNKSYSKVYYYGQTEPIFIIMSWLNIIMIGVLVYQIIDRFVKCKRVEVGGLNK